jgi:hypothetical protein
MNPFCVLEPTLRKEGFCSKVRKTRNLHLLANKMHEP